MISTAVVMCKCSLSVEWQSNFCRWCRWSGTNILFSLPTIRQRQRVEVWVLPWTECSWASCGRRDPTGGERSDSPSRVPVTTRAGVSNARHNFQQDGAQTIRVGQIAGLRTQHQPGAETEEGPQEADGVLRECCMDSCGSDGRSELLCFLTTGKLQFSFWALTVSHVEAVSIFKHTLQFSFESNKNFSEVQV
jgi:hypothetical protein